MTPLKSQLLGLSLGLATAIGCIFYEKLVHSFSYVTLVTIFIIEMIGLLVCALIFLPNEFQSDYQKFISEPKYSIWAVVYMLTGVTSILWYVITKQQGVMTGSLYEVKYIIMLAMIYMAFGDNKFTWNTALGVVLAIGSIYFISKN